MDKEKVAFVECYTCKEHYKIPLQELRGKPSIRCPKCNRVIAVNSMDGIDLLWEE